MKTAPVILVADDDPGFREVAIANLEANGFEAAITTDGEEAVEQVKKLHLGAVTFLKKSEELDTIVAKVKELLAQ